MLEKYWESVRYAEEWWFRNSNLRYIFVSSEYKMEWVNSHLHHSRIRWEEPDWRCQNDVFSVDYFRINSDWTNEVRNILDLTESLCLRGLQQMWWNPLSSRPNLKSSEKFRALFEASLLMEVFSWNPQIYEAIFTMYDVEVCKMFGILYCSQ